MAESLLPLFPLGVVLFPGTLMPLHIFEPRYREMVGEAVDNETEFGIVLAVERGLVSIGCSARVSQVVERYEDGRLDIIVEGTRRFEIQGLDHERAFLRGEVEFFIDEEPEADLTLRQRAVETFRRAFPAQDGEASRVNLESEPLSFQLAQVLSDLESRQQLLQMRSEGERLRRLIEIMPGLARKRELTEKMQLLAPRNGHGKHLT